MKYRILVETRLSYDVMVDANSLADAEVNVTSEINERIHERITDATPDRVVMDIETSVQGIFPEGE